MNYEFCCAGTTAKEDTQSTITLVTLLVSVSLWVDHKKMIDFII